MTGSASNPGSAPGKLAASVIVPTYRRPADILRCLGSLTRQTTSTAYEIIVVDNACDDALAERIAESGSDSAHSLRYLPEPELGVHNARHAGARAARASLLLFTDDDAICAPGWVDAYVTAFARHAEIAAAGGPVRPHWLARPPDWLLELIVPPTFTPLALMDLGERFLIDPRGFFFSVNMAIRREVLFRAGGFSPELHGSIYLGDGETGLNNRLWEAGNLIAYVPEAIVEHVIRPERATLDYMSERLRAQGAADAYSALRCLPLTKRLLLRKIAGALRRGLRSYRLVDVRQPAGLESMSRRLAVTRHLSEAGYYARLLFGERRRELVCRKRWLEAEEPAHRRP